MPCCGSGAKAFGTLSTEGGCPNSFHQRNPVSALQELKPLRADWHAAVAAVQPPPKAGFRDGACGAILVHFNHAVLSLGLPADTLPLALGV